MAKKKRTALDPFSEIRAAQEKREQAIQTMPQKPLEPSGTTNAGFRQLEEVSKKQPMPEAPLTFGSWKSKGNPDSAFTPIMAGITYPFAKAADVFIPDPVKNWGGRVSETGGEIMTMVDRPNKTTTGSGLGDMSADLAGALVGFVANPVGGPANIGAGLWHGAEKGIAAVAPRIPGLKNIPDYIGMGAEKIAPRVPGLKSVADIAPKAKFLAEYTGKVGGATIPWEGTRAYVNDREMSPGEMGLAAGANVGLDLALMGLTKGIVKRGSGKLGKVEENTSFDDLFGDVTPEPAKPEYADWFNEEAFNQHQNRQANTVQDFYAGGKQESPFKPAEQPEPFYATDKFGEYSYVSPSKPEVRQLALPEGKIPNWENWKPPRPEPHKQLALPGIPDYLALSAGKVPNWDYHPGADFTVDPMGKAMAKDGVFPLAKIDGLDYVGDTGLKNRQRIAQDIDRPIPRSDIGDPAYLAELKNRYNQLIQKEVDYLKKEGGQGTIGPSAAVDSVTGDPIPETWQKGGSLNPKWYRDLFAKNATETNPLGSSPRAGQYRNQAIQNLIRGNAETGEPANEEFLSILSELSRGQKLPEEWHGLQKGMRDMDAMQEPELEPLINDMRTEQAKVEPYGLNRDLDRLDEVENGIRGKTRMEDMGDYGQYEDVRFKRGKDYAPTFYSQLQRTIEAKMPNRATTEQIQGIIRGGQVKEEELKWSGLDDFLAERQGQKVTKQEVMDYLKANDVQVEEVTKGEASFEEINAKMREIDAYVRNYADGRFSGGADDRILMAKRQLERNGDPGYLKLQKELEDARSNQTKHETYQLPGGENYRELLFTMPASEKPVLKRGLEIRQDADGSWNVFDKEGPIFKDGKPTKDALESFIAGDEMLFNMNGNSYRSGHWSEPNVLAHVRFNDRTGANGEKILHVEEVQSDWHQEGRRKGYATPELTKAANDAMNEYRDYTRQLNAKYGQVPSFRKMEQAEAEKYKELENKYIATKEAAEGVPDAPFKTTWHEFVMKRMIRYAAENGYDRITWTTGEQQAARYKEALLKEVDQINYSREADGKYSIMAYKNGRFVDIDRSGRSMLLGEKELEGALGKEIAQKIVSGAGANSAHSDKVKVLSGENITIGGEGMKGFYDRMIPSWLNKYAKKWGARVEGSEVDGQGVHSLPITESMRESVLYEGQPKFKKAPPEIQAVLKKASDETGWRKEWAPGAMKSERFQAANELSKVLTGREIITYTSREGEQGFAMGRQAFINARSKQPTLYVAAHEITHTMEVSGPEFYSQFKDIVIEHVADDPGIINHYVKKFNYDPVEVPDELVADILAECMVQKSFWERVRDKAPELLKPILDTIDRILTVAKKQAEVPGKYEMMKYMKDVEVMRDRLAVVYRDYLKAAKEEQGFVEQYGNRWQDSAAKAKAESKIIPGDINTPEFRKWFGDSKVVDESGKPIKVYHGTSNGGFTEFDPQKIPKEGNYFGKGFYFTNKKNVAKTYETKGSGETPQTFTTFLSLKNPLDIDANGETISREFINYLKENNERVSDGMDWWFTDEARRAKGKNYNQFLTSVAAAQNEGLFQTFLRNKGYDGITHIGGKLSGGPKHQVYVAFDPTQIKSVNNRGTWDPTNPDIRYKLGETRSRADDMREMVLAAAKQFPKSMGFTEGFKSAMKKQFPQVTDEPQAEAILKYVYDRATELRKGQTTFKGDGQTITLTKADLGTGGAAGAQAGSSDIDTSKHIVTKTQREPIVAKESVKMVYTKAVDDLYRLDELDRFVSKTTGKHLPAEDKAYLLAINSREATGAARAILEENLVDAQGNVIGKSFKEVLSKIPKGKEQEFRDYLVLRNSISWMEQGKQVYPEKWGMTPEKAMQRLAAYDQQTPGLKKAADEYTNWHRDMAKAWLVDTGIITPDAWQAFLTAHPHYTPFQRQMKPIETTPGQGKARRGFANQTNPTKKAEGSERPIVDPVESTIEQIDRYIKTAKRNEVMQAVVRNLKKAPDELTGFAEIIPEKGVDALDNIDVILSRDGIDGVINYLEEPFEQMIARKGKSEQPLDKPNVVRALVNGERVHVKVNDPVLLDALTALSDTGRNAIVESFRTATRLMKVLTTGGNPIFATRNITRDVPMAYVASDTLSKTPIVREAQFAWGMLDALARIVTNEKWHPDKFYREYKAMGGGSHTASVAADRNLLAESKSRVMPGYWRPENNSPIDYVGKAAKAGFQGIERFTSTVEALPRLPEYIRTVKKGGNDYASKLEGLHKSQDVTVNFSRHGDISKDADAFIPYFNAAMQGIDKIARMFGSDPVGATYRSIVAVTVPTIWLYLQFNKDNPNYHKLPSHIRDNYYCIPKSDGKFIKIAKPREIGVVFSDLPERALRKWEADDPEGFYQFSEAWINNFVPPVRPIVMPIADVMRNKDFAERPIVPGYMEGLSPELQYDEKTSAAAKTIGNALKLSPKQIDYLFRSYTGVIGELGIPAMAEGKGQNAGQRVGEVLSRTFTADPLYSNDITNKFYEQKERLDTAAKDYKATGNKGEYYDPGAQRYYNRQADRISNIRKQIRKVNADPDLSFKEKEERTRRMQANMLEIAGKAVEDRFSPRANIH